MRTSTACFFPVVGYQAVIMEQIAQRLILSKEVDRAIFLCPTIGAYRSVSSKFERIFLPAKVRLHDDLTISRETLPFASYELKKLRVEHQWNINLHITPDRLEKEAASYSLYWDQFLDDHEVRAILIWNGYFLPQQTLIGRAQKLGIPLLYLENGYEPGSFVIDPVGINAKSSFVPMWKQTNTTFVESDHPCPVTFSGKDRPFVKRILNYLAIQARIPHYRRKYGAFIRYEHSPSVFQKARQIAQSISGTSRIPKQTRGNIVLFPLQVVTDSQLLENFHGYQEQAVLQLVESIEKLNKDENVPACLYIKDHPRQITIQYIRTLKKKIRSNYVVFIEGGNIQSLIDNSTVVVTINSSVGYQAMKRKKPVIVLGESVYTGAGLARQLHQGESLTEILKEALQNPDQFYDECTLETFLSNYQSYCFFQNQTSLNKASQLVARYVGGESR